MYIEWAHKVRDLERSVTIAVVRAFIIVSYSIQPVEAEKVRFIKVIGLLSSW